MSVRSGFAIWARACSNRAPYARRIPFNERMVGKSEVIIGRALREDLEVNRRDTPLYTTEVCLPVSHYQ